MPAIEPGRTIGREFVVERPLSSGGMGAVFVAVQKSTGVRRALKLMRPELVRDPRLRERFVQEARVSSSIPSDHVVQVITAGIDDDTSIPFLVMELLDGDELATAIQTRGPVDLQTFGVIFQQLCHAVGAAHEAGIVHRDLKPENIFLARSRIVGASFVVKVLDFGIAKLVAEARAHTTESMGTPLWMAPEQTARGSSISAQTDVWALGLIAFFCLTGRTYWSSADDEHPSLERILRELLIDDLVRPSKRAVELGQELPSWFDGWFERCVNREPRLRFSDAKAAWDDLARCIETLAVNATRPMNASEVPATHPWSPEPGSVNTPYATLDAHTHPTKAAASLQHARESLPLPSAKLTGLRWPFWALAGGALVVVGTAIPWSLKRTPDGPEPTTLVDKIELRDDVVNEPVEDRRTPRSPAASATAGPAESVMAPTLSVPITEDRVQTRRGELSVSSENTPALWKWSLALDGKEILHKEWAYISLVRYFQQTERDLILLSSDGVGTAYNSIKDSLFFLVLPTTGKFKFIMLDDQQQDLGGHPLFSSFGAPDVMVAEADRILLALGFDSGKRKLAELSGETLKVFWEAAPREFVGEEKCRWVRDGLQACSDFVRDFDPTCERIALPGYLNGAERLDEPGFQAEAFDRLCKTACRTGVVPTYEVVEQTVCGK